jgi:hypothetical protein
VKVTKNSSSFDRMVDLGRASAVVYAVNAPFVDLPCGERG